jgi:hypothetical protein
MVRGTPTYWHAGAGSLVPHLQLVAVQFQQTQQALGLSGLVLLLILIGWLLSYFPRLVSWLQALWPEQLILFGGLGWLLLEPSLLFALPVVLGVGARLICVARWWLTILKRSAPAAGSTGSGMTRAT